MSLKDIIQVIILIISAIIVIVPVIFRDYFEKDNSIKARRNQEHVIIRLPKYYFWVFLGSSIGFGNFLIATLLSETFHWANFIGFSLFFLVGLWGLLASKVWKIEIFRDRDYFIYHSYIGIKHTIRYEDCVSYRFRLIALDAVLTVKAKKTKKYIIEMHASNTKALLQMLRQHGVKEEKYEPSKFVRFLLKW